MKKLIAEFIGTAKARCVFRPCFESVVAHLHESICLWLDDGDPERDELFHSLLTGGLRAMVGQWSAMEGTASDR